MGPPPAKRPAGGGVPALGVRSHASTTKAASTPRMITQRGAVLTLCQARPAAAEEVGTPGDSGRLKSFIQGRDSNARGRVPKKWGGAGLSRPPRPGGCRKQTTARCALQQLSSKEVQRILRLPPAGAAGRGLGVLSPGTPMPEPSLPDAKPSILIVDDDRALCAMLAEYLGPEGFVTRSAETGPQGLEQLAHAAVDLVVLDVMLPELSGFEVLRRIRASSRVPVIMLTARGEEVDRVVGLELGADDYLAKPFSPRELVARIRAVLRRTPAETTEATETGVLTFGPLELDLRARRARVAEHDLELTAAELRILELLVRADTRTVSREDLMLQALGRRLLPTDRSLDTHVSNLRRKLLRYTDRVNVQSVRGTGYALTLAPARSAEPAAGEGRAPG